jgi:anti-sigma factor ChrR (cupin superfamily)
MATNQEIYAQVRVIFDMAAENVGAPTIGQLETNLAEAVAGRATAEQQRDVAQGKLDNARPEADQVVALAEQAAVEARDARAKLA